MATSTIAMQFCELPTPLLSQDEPESYLSHEMPSTDLDSVDSSCWVPKISNMQAAWNIFNANQGVVILSLPFAMKLGGVIPVCLVTAMVAAVSNYTSKNLILCLYETDQETGVTVRVRSTYDDVGGACGGLLGRVLICAAMLIEQLCYCTVNLILCSNILFNAFTSIPLEKYHWVIITFVILAPNALLATVQQVSVLSLVTVVAGNSVYLAVSIYCCISNDVWFDQILTPNVDLDGFFTAAGIVVASYASQPYMPTIEGSMKHPAKFNAVADITFFVITIIKIGFGWLGFEAYGEDTRQVITNNLPHGLLRSICVAIVMILALMSFTLPAFTVYTLADTIKQSMDFTRTGKLPHKYSLLVSESPSVLQQKFSILTSIVSGVRDMFSRMLLLSFAPLMAIFIPHFGYYVALVGNVTGICLSLIFPSICYMKLKYEQLSVLELVLHSGVVSIGCIAAGIGVYCSSSALYTAIANEQT